MEILIILEPFFNSLVILSSVVILSMVVCIIVTVASYADKKQSADRAALRIMLGKLVRVLIVLCIVCAVSAPLSQPMEIYGKLFIYRAAQLQAARISADRIANNIRISE